MTLNSKTLLDQLHQSTLILDGAMGTMIQNLDLTDEDFGGPDYRMLSDLLSFSRPEELKNIHKAYYDAGADAVETNSFGASPFRLEEFNFAGLDTSRFEKLASGLDLAKANINELTYAMNVQAAKVACQAREESKAAKGFNGRPLYVFGSIGPSNRVLSATPADLKKASWDEVVENFYQQGLGLIDGGVDAFLHETQQDILELKAAIAGSLKAMRERKTRLPIIAQVTVDQFSRMQIFNTDVLAASITMSGTGVDVFGINCSIGPDLMKPTVQRLAENSPLPISCVPNAGLPVSENGKTVFKMKPSEFAEILADMVGSYKISIAGGCCGTSPDYIRALSGKLRG